MVSLVTKENPKQLFFKIIVTALRAGRSGVWSPVGAWDLSLFQIGPGAHSMYTAGAAGGVFLGWSGLCIKLATHLHLASSLRVSGVVPLLPLLRLHDVGKRQIDLYGSYMFRLDVTRVKKWRMFWKEAVVALLGWRNITNRSSAQWSFFYC
jgi:hypothetical protein